MNSNKVVPGNNDAPSHRRPNPSPFHQQTVKAYKPVPTVKSAAIIFTVLGVIFIIVGAVLLAYSKEIIEHKARYDNKDDCKNTKWDEEQICEIEFEIDKKMKKPVYFYYQLNNFYQNHRRYVKSKSAEQLAGTKMSKSDVKTDCDPIITMKDLGRIQKHINGTNAKINYMDDGVVALPCGLIAKTFFNDTYELYKGSDKKEIDENDIAWPSDKEKKFKKNDDEEDDYWTDVENGNK